MTSPERSVVRRTSEAAIQRQIRWVQAAIALRNYPSRNRAWALPQEVISPNGAIDPNQAQAMLESNHLNEAYRSTSKYHPGFLPALREMNQNDPTMTDGFSPVLARAILEKINEHTWTRRSFRKTDIETAVSGEEYFQHILLKKIEANPKKFKDVVGSFAPILPTEGITIVLNSLVEEKIDFFDTLSRVFSHYYDKTQLAGLIVQYSTDERVAPGLFTYFTYDRISSLFTPDQQQQIVNNMLQFPVDAERRPLEDYIARGLITHEQAPSIIIRSFEENPLRTRILKDCIDFFPEGSAEREALKISVRDAFLSKEGRNPFLSKLKDVQESGLLTVEEIADLARRYKDIHSHYFYMYLESLPELLPAEEVREIVMDALRRREIFALHSASPVLMVFGNDIFTPADREEVLNIFTVYYPRGILSKFEDLGKLITPDEASRILTGVLEKAEPKTSLSEITQWIDHIPEAERKTLLLDLMQRDTALEFLTVVTQRSGYPYRENPLQTYFSSDEILAVTAQHIDESPYAIFAHLHAIREIIGDHNLDRFKGFVESVRERHPHVFASQFGKIPEYNYQPIYNADEIMEMIYHGVMTQSTTAMNWIDSISTWGPKISKEFTWEFLQHIKKITNGRLLLNLENVIPYVPEDQHHSFIMELIHINPGHALSKIKILSLYDETLTKEQIVADALADQERFSFASRTLKNLFDELNHANPSVRIRALREITSVYEQIATIRQDGDLEYIFSLATKNLPPLTKNDAKVAEKEILATVSFLGTLREKNANAFERVQREIHGLGETGVTREALQLQLFKELGYIMKADPDSITVDNIARFNESMHSIYPFMIYFLDQQSSPEHVDLLRGLFESVLTGTYLEWKFSLGDSGVEKKTLDELKKTLGLLPTNLDETQYERWQQDESTSYEEILTVTAEDVSVRVRQVLGDNAKHLPDMFFDDAGFRADTARLGHQLDQAKKHMGMIKHDVGQDTPEYLKAKEETMGLVTQMEKLKLFGLLRRFLHLSPEEVSANRLNNTDRKKYPGIRDVLRDIRSVFTPEDVVIIDQIESLVDSYFQSEGVQSITVSDTATPGVLLELGAKPVATCQHYETGGYREGLISYLSEPNTKTLIIRNANNNILARALFRLLEDPEGNTALHIERIYSSVASPAIDMLMQSHASKKAKNMGIPLYEQIRSDSNPHNEADNAGAEQIDDSKPRAGTALMVRDIRAPYVYVDSAGGILSNGYTITDTVKIG